ncbi:MAG: HlyD family secretion protein [Pirellulaceae bacterium]
MTHDPPVNVAAIAGTAPEPVAPARREKTIGFPVSDESQPARPVDLGRSAPRREVTPSRRGGRPVPKRPKGRWFITLFVCAIAGLIGHKIWSEFGRNQAYGVMQGRVLEIRTPWNGIVESMHVRDGQRVEQGQLLATINNFELRNERVRLKHDLEIALAELAMRVADIQSREQIQQDSVLQLQVEQFQLLGKLHSERARLEELQSQYEINRGLYTTRSVPRTELDRNRIQLASQNAVVKELTGALDKLRESVQRVEQRTDSVLQPLMLQQTRIQSIESEFSRLSELESMGEIRAPVQGVIVRRHQFTGEFIGKNTALFELLEHDSLEAVVYLPQFRARQFQVGDEVNLVLPPESEPRRFRIARFGDQMVQPPESIERFYNAKQRLIPVHAVPLAGQIPESQAGGFWWLGAEVRLPRLGYRTETNDSWFTRLTRSIGF